MYIMCYQMFISFLVMMYDNNKQKINFNSTLVFECDMLNGKRCSECFVSMVKNVSEKSA